MRLPLSADSMLMMQNEATKSKGTRYEGARVETRQTVERDLSRLELDLADKFSLPEGTVRLEIIRRLRSGEIRETELVAKWHRLYSALMRWIEEEEPAAPKPRELSEKEAAESGLFFCLRFFRFFTRIW